MPKPQLFHMIPLRAISVILVILYHFDIHLLKGGFLGVDVFFVISGFLITRILNNEFNQTGKIDFGKFYKRRIRRLMPTLFITILLTFVLTFLVFSPSDFMNTTKSMFMSSVALANFHFLRDSNYFDTSSMFKPLLHTWSLGVEEQFYLIFPILLLLICKSVKSTKGRTCTLITLLGISFLFPLLGNKLNITSFFSFLTKHDAALGTNFASIQFYLLPFRAYEFLLGAVAAFIPKRKTLNQYFLLFINSVGLVLIIVPAFIISKDTEYLSIKNIIPCSGVMILLVFSASSKLNFLFNNVWIKYIGKISYTLYLIHWVIVVIYGYLFGTDFNTIDILIMSLIILGLSVLIYEFYEKPLRISNTKYSLKTNWSIATFMILFIAFTFGCKSAVNENNGWLWRLDTKNKELIKAIGIPKNFHINNWGGAGYKEGWVSEELNVNSTPDILLMGDSHCAHYLYGLDSILVKKHHKQVFIHDWFSSFKLPQLKHTRKDEKYEELRTMRYEQNLALAKKYPKSAIIMSYYWDAQINNSAFFDTENSSWHNLKSDSVGYEIVCKQIVEFHKQIGTHHKLIIIGSTPTTDNNDLNYVENLFKPKYLSKFSPTISVFKHNHIKANTFFQAYFYNHKNIYFINPAEAFCTDGQCIKQRNNKIYFSDYSHLSHDGSLRAVMYMEAELLSIVDNF